MSHDGLHHIILISFQRQIQLLHFYDGTQKVKKLCGFFFVLGSDIDDFVYLSRHDFQAGCLISIKNLFIKECNIMFGYLILQNRINHFWLKKPVGALNDSLLMWKQSVANVQNITSISAFPSGGSSPSMLNNESILLYMYIWTCELSFVRNRRKVSEAVRASFTLAYSFWNITISRIHCLARVLWTGQTNRCTLDVRSCSVRHLMAILFLPITNTFIHLYLS